MMTVTHPLAEDYLRRLERAARVLPRRQREELLAEIRSHLDAGLPPDPTEADVRNLLDELGTPAEIVAAAQPDRPPARRGIREALALVLLVVGFVPLLGWVVGAALLLSSPLWSVRQKLLGILVWPGGLFTVLAFGGVGASVQTASCPPVQADGTAPDASTAGAGAECVVSGTTGWQYAGMALWAFMLVAPLLVAGYLWWAAGRRAEAA